MYYTTTYQSPLGLLTLACDGERLVGLWIEGQKYFGKSVPGELRKDPKLPVLLDAADWLDAYFAGENPDPSRLPLRPLGSEFRQRVWELLRQIPYGEVTTYGEIGKKVALQMNRKSMSGQAVGGAVGHNPISILIPCHRVVGSNGSLTGYAGGIENKRKLLKLEGVDLSRFTL